MILTGTVRNVIDFGAFVDIGVHQDGLVHISQICDSYIKHPAEVLSVGDIVKVKVLSVDTARHRIGLTMKLGEGEGGGGLRLLPDYYPEGNYKFTSGGSKKHQNAAL